MLALGWFLTLVQGCSSATTTILSHGSSTILYHAQYRNQTQKIEVFFAEKENKTK